jgi:hypothetical protein
MKFQKQVIVGTEDDDQDITLCAEVGMGPMQVVNERLFFQPTL